jgi:hypothetical protein
MLFARARVTIYMTISGEEQWWLEEIPGGFVLVHAAHGRDVACRIDCQTSDELRERVAGLICELRELINDPAAGLI